MRRVIVRLLCSLAMVAVAPAPVTADDRSAVTVRVVLADRDYRAHVPPAELPDLEAALAERIARHLQGRIGFVRFTAQSGADSVLAFELDRQDRSGTSALREVGFHITLHQASQPLGEKIYVRFRSQTETFNQILGREALLEAVGPKVAEASGPRGPITTLLSWLPITRPAVFMSSPLGWAIPYRHDDLCMDNNTRVRLPTRIKSAVASVVHDFTARTSGALTDGDRILGVPDPQSQAHLDDLKNARPDQVLVETFYVVEYSPKARCDAVIAPR